jgi:hypothetical protein
MKADELRGFASNSIAIYERKADRLIADGLDVPAHRFLGAEGWVRTDGANLGLLEIARDAISTARHGLEKGAPGEVTTATAIHLCFVAGVAMGLAEGRGENLGRAEEITATLASNSKFLSAALARMRRSSAKAWARKQHAELTRDEYSRYREKTAGDKAKHLFAQWGTGPGKYERNENGEVRPALAAFERYVREFTNPNVK